MFVPTGAFNGALTTIRLLRLLKLARYWRGLAVMLRILGNAVRSGIYLLMLVLLFMFVMGLLGLQVRFLFRIPSFLFTLVAVQV